MNGLFFKNTSLDKVFLIQYDTWYLCFSESYYFTSLETNSSLLTKSTFNCYRKFNRIKLLQPVLLSVLLITPLKLVTLIKYPVLYWLYWCFLILEYSQGFCCTLWDDSARSNEMGSLSYKISSTGNESASVKEFGFHRSSTWELNYIMFLIFQAIHASF